MLGIEWNLKIVYVGVIVSVVGVVGEVKLMIFLVVMDIDVKGFVNIKDVWIVLESGGFIVIEMLCYDIFMYILVDIV